jgi:hypothetical protein
VPAPGYQQALIRGPQPKLPSMHSMTHQHTSRHTAHGVHQSLLKAPSDGGTKPHHHKNCTDRPCILSLILANQRSCNLTARWHGSKLLEGPSLSPLDGPGRSHPAMPCSVRDVSTFSDGASKLHMVQANSMHATSTASTFTPGAAYHAP